MRGELAYWVGARLGRRRTAAGGQAPVVVAETDIGHLLLLASADLDACGGSIDRLVEATERSAVRLGAPQSIVAKLDRR